jgi:hypothetical protein
MLADILNDLKTERQQIQRKQAAAFSVGLAARLVWNVTKWVLLFFVIGGVSILWLLIQMAIGGKGWR